MTAQILDGNALAKSIRERLRSVVADWTKRGFRPPGLAVILVGDDPASAIYHAHHSVLTSDPLEQ